MKRNRMVRGRDAMVRATRHTTRRVSDWLMVGERPRRAVGERTTAKTTKNEGGGGGRWWWLEAGAVAVAGAAAEAGAAAAMVTAALATAEGSRSRFPGIRAQHTQHVHVWISPSYGPLSAFSFERVTPLHSTTPTQLRTIVSVGRAIEVRSRPETPFIAPYNDGSTFLRPPPYQQSTRRSTIRQI